MKRFDVHLEAVNEDRKIRVDLPKSYMNDGQKCF